MQHQYWVTKKSVLRKLGGKEDDCIVSSDAELDAKLELFKSINESCIHLQRVIDLYQERLCYLAQEENALGRYLKECGKNERNANAGQIMSVAGKAVSYSGHQRLTVRPSLVRLHHEVETFRGRAVSDTRVTVTEMEKARTEYRAALSWMKSASAQLDPDTGLGLEKFRKAQSYVKTTKVKFDKYTLACLQKVDLLAAARCNMFSHALIPYLSSLKNFARKSTDTLNSAATKLESVQPGELTVPGGDRDKNLFFNSEYSDNEKPVRKSNTSNINKPGKETSGDDASVTNLLGEDFSELQEPEKSPQNDEENLSGSFSSQLLNLSWPTANELEDAGVDAFMPSKLLQQGDFDLSQLGMLSSNQEEKPKSPEMCKEKIEKNAGHVSWLSLFAELDPLASPAQGIGSSGDCA